MSSNIILFPLSVVSRTENRLQDKSGTNNTLDKRITRSASLSSLIRKQTLPFPSAFTCRPSPSRTLGISSMVAYVTNTPLSHVICIVAPLSTTHSSAFTPFWCPVHKQKASGSSSSDKTANLALYEGFQEEDCLLFFGLVPPRWVNAAWLCCFGGSGHSRLNVPSSRNCNTGLLKGLFFSVFFPHGLRELDYLGCRFLSFGRLRPTWCWSHGTYLTSLTVSPTSEQSPYSWPVDLPESSGAGIPWAHNSFIPNKCFSALSPSAILAPKYAVLFSYCLSNRSQIFTGQSKTTAGDMANVSLIVALMHRSSNAVLSPCSAPVASCSSPLTMFHSFLDWS